MELNKVYCMDNLELLKQLPNNSVDLIYGDILYATGRNFDDYKDLPYDKRKVLISSVHGWYLDIYIISVGT